MDIACGPNGNLYILDAWNNRIQVFDTKGTPIQEKKSGFWFPSTITIDKKGIVYVSDNGSRTIKRFSSRLVPKGTLSGSTLRDGKFFIPIAVAVDDRGHVYVAESDNHRFQIVDGTGKHVNSWPLYGSGPICRIIVLSPDQILLSDANQRKIYVFNDRGEILTKTGLEKIQYNFPTGFHVDGKNKLYLLDGSRILVFSVINNDFND
jgi:DNA-binding beta-propeller fold protein YncE